MRKLSMSLLGPLLLVSLVAACATARAPAPSGPVVAAASVSTGLAYRPLPAARLADPGMRAGVQQCEASGKPHCREYGVPGKPQESFTEGVDPQIVAAFVVGGMKPGLVSADCRFIGPTGEPEVIVGIPDLDVPSGLPADQTLTLSCPLKLDSTVPAGTGRVELWLNGHLASSLPFTVKGGA